MFLTSRIKKKIPNLIDLTYTVFRINHLLYRFPTYTDEEWQNEVYEPQNDREEMEKLSHFRKILTLGYVMYIIGCALIISKSLLYPIYTILSVNTMTEQYGNTQVTPNNRSQELTFGCLRTNCSGLNDRNHVLNDLITLPVFKICFPRLRSYYLPMIDTNLIGLIAHGVLYYAFFMSAVAMPIAFHTNPLSHSLIVFNFAPSAVRRCYAEEARKYLMKRLVSFKCYFYNSRNDLLPTESRMIGNKLVYSMETPIDGRTRQERAYLTPENSQIAQLNADYNYLNERVRNYIDDCAMFIRSDYYRPTMLRQYWIYMFVSYVLITCFVSQVFLVSYLFAIYNDQWFSSIDEYVRSTGCAIWRSTEDAIITEHVQISGPRTQFSFMTILECVIILILLIFFFSNSLATSVMCLQELVIEISAQIDKLELLIEITDIMLKRRMIYSKTRGFQFDPQSLSGADSDYDFGFQQLHLLHQQRLRFILGVSYLTPLMDIKKTDDRLERGTNCLREMAIDQLMKHGFNMDVYLTALVKVYVGVRVLAHQVDKTSRNLTRILSCAYVITLGIFVIVFGFSKEFNGRYTTAIEFVIFFLVLTSLIIAAAAGVQTKSRRLLNQIWQLVAISNEFEDLRIRHMRLLWIKQAIALSEESGMTMKAYYIPVTYNRMIQLILLMSSLIILSFSH